LFQSLFWWILLLNRTNSIGFQPPTAVSILVLVDFALKRSWEEVWEQALSGRFNPCFGGFCS